MEKHVVSFKIESFRGIKNLELAGLKEINILTGDNNSGKTSVLEVINYLSGLDSLRNLAFSTTRSMRQSLRTELSWFERINYLFPIDEEKSNIKYSFCSQKGDFFITINKDNYFEMLPEREVRKMQGFRDSSAKDLSQDEMIDVENIKLDFIINNETVKTQNVSEFGSIRSEVIRKKAFDTVFITPFRHTFNDIYLTDVLNNVNLYQEMLEVLQEFDEEIIGINVDSKGKTYRKKYMILSKNHKEAIPLELYGDGMKKTILLMSAVIAAKNGILLLDEFETAIHTSAMDKIFAWILNTCMKLNVQLFITSHSKEAIEKVLKCCPNLSDSINLYTLFKKNNNTLVRTLSCDEAIEAIDKFGLEVR